MTHQRQNRLDKEKKRKSKFTPSFNKWNNRSPFVLWDFWKTKGATTTTINIITGDTDYFINNVSSATTDSKVNSHWHVGWKKNKACRLRKTFCSNAKCSPLGPRLTCRSSENTIKQDPNKRTKSQKQAAWCI